MSETGLIDPVANCYIIIVTRKGKDVRNMTANANAMAMENRSVNRNVRAGGRKSLGERFKEYMLSNAEYFFMAGSLMTGNAASYCAYKIAESRIKEQSRQQAAQ